MEEEEEEEVRKKMKKNERFLFDSILVAY